MRRDLPRLCAVALLAIAGCRHAAPVPATPRAEILWPAPPAAPRVRLAAQIPDPEAPPPPLPWWRVALRWVTGVDPQEAEPLLQRPFGVAVDGAGAVVVADPDTGRVLRFAAGAAPDELRCARTAWGAPMAVAPGADGAIFVADAAAGTIVRWTKDRCTTLGKGELDRPTGVAVGPDGIWVADPGRHQVIELSLAGVVVRRIGERGDGEGRFNFPSSVALSPDGTVLVVDALNFRIVRLAADGRWAGSFGAQGDEGAAFLIPKAVAVDAGGHIFVSDAQRDVVLAFAPDGTFEWAFGDTGSEPGRFVHPAGLAVAAGRIIVADTQNRRIQIFERIGERS